MGKAMRCEICGAYYVGESCYECGNGLGAQRNKEDDLSVRDSLDDDFWNIDNPFNFFGKT